MTTAAKTGITGIDASYYMTKDLGKATSFYSALFAFEPTMHIPNMVSEWTFEANDSTFGLYQPQNADDWRPGGGLLFGVPDIQAAVDAAKAAGAKFDEHVEDTPVCYMAFGQDPEGSYFILHQLK